MWRTTYLEKMLLWWTRLNVPTGAVSFIHSLLIKVKFKPWIETKPKWCIFREHDRMHSLDLQVIGR